jgi:hypothetical protein
MIFLTKSGAVMIKDYSDEFNQHLFRNERIIWSGQPKQGFILRKHDIYLIPASCLGLLIYVFLILSMINEMFMINEKLPLLFVIAMFFVGLGFLHSIIGRFFIETYQRKYTFYAISTERIIILKNKPRASTKSLFLKKISEININTMKDGIGTITFGPVYTAAYLLSSFPWIEPQKEISPSFELIKDAKKVFDLLHETLQEI